jgi:fucose permease
LREDAHELRLAGAGGGALNGATNTLVADLHADPRQKNSALNLLGVFFGFGALLLPFMIGTLLETLGLVAILRLAAALGSALGVALLAAARWTALAGLGVAVTGLSFAGIYPTVLGQAGSRFQEHSGTVFGILFAIALTGGMTLPWLVGQLGQAYGLRVALLAPVGNALMIFALQAAVTRIGATGPAPR